MSILYQSHTDAHFKFEELRKRNSFDATATTLKLKREYAQMKRL